MIRTFKRGSRWSYAFEAGKEKGKRKTITKSGFETKAEAEEAGMLAFADFKRGVLPADNRLTWKKFANDWLAKASKEVSVGTYQHYKYSLSRFTSYIGEDILLEDIRPRDIDDFVKQMAIDGMSKGTISVTKSTVSQVFAYAIYPAEVISNNPCFGIKIPKSAPKKVVERRVIPKEEYLQCIETACESHRVILSLLYFTGMRIGEVLGLVWEDIDFEANRIYVNGQLQTIEKKTFYKPPKTESGIRAIGLLPELRAVLLRWKEYQKKLFVNYVNNGMVYASSGECDGEPLNLVCTQGNGKYTMYTSVQKLLKKYGTNAHSFRHTFATIAIERGASSKSVATVLGHTNTLMTDKYTHSTERMIDEVTNAIEKTT